MLNSESDHYLDKTVSIGLVTYAKALHNHDFVVGAYAIRLSKVIGWNWDFKGQKMSYPTPSVITQMRKWGLKLRYLIILRSRPQ
ncbi:MAG TPA: hypothetical protein V6D14_29155 [Coleofasciculaceae cyanobacterium]